MNTPKSWRESTGRDRPDAPGVEADELGLGLEILECVFGSFLQGTFDARLVVAVVGEEAEATLLPQLLQRMLRQRQQTVLVLYYKGQTRGQTSLGGNRNEAGAGIASS